MFLYVKIKCYYVASKRTDDPWHTLVAQPLTSFHWPSLNVAGTARGWTISSNNYHPILDFTKVQTSVHQTLWWSGSVSTYTMMIPMTMIRTGISMHFNRIGLKRLEIRPIYPMRYYRQGHPASACKAWCIIIMHHRQNKGEAKNLNWTKIWDFYIFGNRGNMQYASLT